MIDSQGKNAQRLQDILDELVDLRRQADALGAEALRLYAKQVGDHVSMDKDTQGVLVHVSCKLGMDQSHYQLVLTEHIARLSTTGRPMNRRTQRRHILAEEWLARGAVSGPSAKERLTLVRPATICTEV